MTRDLDGISAAVDRLSDLLDGVPAPTRPGLVDTRIALAEALSLLEGRIVESRGRPG
jgi:hypothetical protein